MKTPGIFNLIIPIIIFSTILCGCSKQKMTLNKLDGEWEVIAFDFERQTLYKDVDHFEIHFKEYDSQNGECYWQLTFENEDFLSIRHQYKVDEKGEYLTFLMKDINLKMKISLDDERLDLKGLYHNNTVTMIAQKIAK